MKFNYFDTNEIKSSIHQKVQSFKYDKSNLLFYGSSFFLLLGILGKFFLNEKLIVFSQMTIFLMFIWYFILNLYDHFFMIMFYISFFNFLLSRSILICLGFFVEKYEFTTLESVNGQLIVLLSLFIISNIYRFLSIKSKKRKTLLNEKDKSIEYSILEKDLVVSKFLTVLFYFCYLFLLVNIFSVIAYSISNGYASIYVDQTPKVPLIIKKIGDLSFFLYMGVLYFNPSKKKFLVITSLWVLYLLFTLLSGSRFIFVINVLVILAYVIYRNGVEDGRWVSKKLVVYLVLTGVLLIILLSFINYSRFGDQVDKKPIDLLLQFFYDQGVNINNNKRIFRYRSIIPDNKLYVLNQSIKFFDRNFSRFLGRNYLVGNSLEMVKYGNSLADIMSHHLLGVGYLKGFGVATSYIAVLFVQLGYVGVIVGSSIYAYIFSKIQLLYHNSIYLFIFSFQLLTGLLRTPRADFDYFVIKVLDPMLWISFLIIFIATKKYKQIGSFFDNVKREFQNLRSKYEK